MKVLLAGKFGPHGSRPIGGLQTWQKTVGQCLMDEGHEVVYWQAGQAVRFKGREFDVGILANWELTGHLERHCVDYINMIHGPIKAEAPGPERRCYTSEELAEKWGDVYGRVIRQPIDLSYWRPTNVERYQLTRFSYRNGLGFMPGVAEALKLKFHHLKDAGPLKVRRHLQRSALVFATGRASLEAMACGAPVVICDHRSAYQGPLMDTNIERQMRRNYSGRGGVEPTLGRCTKAGTEALGESMRAHVEKHHDAKKITRRLIDAATS